jgi:hypothetical protein
MARSVAPIDTELNLLDIGHSGRQNTLQTRSVGQVDVTRPFEWVTRTRHVRMLVCDLRMHMMHHTLFALCNPFVRFMLISTICFVSIGIY